MLGKIIKIHRGIYYVETNEIIPCKARGLFREQNINPMVGDNVRIRISTEDGSGYIEEVLERKNELLRPPVANVDQVLIVMSLKEPDINTFLLDRFLLMCEKSNVPAMICINKADLLSKKDMNAFFDIYKPTGYPVIFTSVEQNKNLEQLIQLTDKKTTVFAGPSGVGKSSLLNAITSGQWSFQTGDLSSKTKRGKHTTRHIELINEGEETFFLDTPGFSSLDLRFFEFEDEVKEYMVEFLQYSGNCKFNNCNHLKEPGCEVKKALEQNHISQSRYRSYQMMYDEVKANRRY